MKRLFSLATAMMLGACSVLHAPSTSALDAGAVGGDSGTADAGTLALVDAGPAADAVCVPLVAKRCEYLQRCGLISSDARGLSDCRGYFEATWCGPTKWPTRIAPRVGTLRYDATRARACAEAFDTLSCAEWQTEPPACGQFLLPNAQLRQTCYDGYSECVEGVCRGVSCDDRKCRPLGGDGEDCRESSECRAGLLCRKTSSLGVGVCSTPVQLGLPCADDSECVAGLSCLGTCIALPTSGQPCAMGRCDSMSYCAGAVTGGSCAPRRLPGGACMSDDQCLPGLLCDPKQQVCVTAIVSGLLAECSGGQTCAGTLTCVIGSSGSGSCKQPSAAASNCTASSDCEPHLACANDVCVPRGALGTRCKSSRDCGVFSACVASKCSPRPLVGESCSAEAPCLLGTCASVGADAGLRCVDSVGPGSQCTTNDECASGRCERGTCLAACTP